MANRAVREGVVAVGKAARVKETMNFKSAEVIKASLKSALDERERALNHIDFDIEMKEQAIQRARSAGAKTRATNELDALKVERVRRVQRCCEMAQAIAEFDAMVDL